MSILGCGKSGAKRAAVVVAALVALPACVSFQALEPVISPPGVYQRDNRVMVEFVHPAMVGIRCAERGVRFMGMPGVNSGACADAELITMANPCFTVTGGWYAETLCHELAHVNGWAHDHRGGLLFARHEPIRRASDSPEALALAAAEATQETPPQRASLQLAAAGPSDFAIVPIEPLVVNLPSFRSPLAAPPALASQDVVLLEPLTLPGLGEEPVAMAQAPALDAEPIAARTPRPLEEPAVSLAPEVIQIAAVSPVASWGTSAGSSGPAVPARLGLRPIGLGLGPALPEPLP
jgi:hypothetical protein